MTVGEVFQLLGKISYERDIRKPPDNLRRGQFKAGWEDATLRRKTRKPYAEETLQYLTWRNLGYRLGLAGSRDADDIYEVYENLVGLYGNPKVNGPLLLPDEIVDPARLVEGAVCRVSVNAYERNPEARRRCIARHGTNCYICGFNFGRVYGLVAEGLIHVHHLRPLSEIGAEYTVDPEKDLCPVCPNCHAVLHRRTPPFSVEELRALLGHRRLTRSISTRDL